MLPQFMWNQPVCSGLIVCCFMFLPLLRHSEADG
jgi:hypothetical protein